MAPSGWQPPEWLQGALDARPRAVSRFRAPLATAEPGDLRVAQIGDLRRIVLIEFVDDDNATAIVALITPEIENALDLDLILRPGATGVAYALAVEGTIRSSVFLAQLGPRLGRVSDPDLRAIRVLRAIAADDEVDEAPAVWDRRGLPLVGREDARWAWRQAEIADMRALGAAVTQWVVDDDVERDEPGLVAAAAASSAPPVLEIRGEEGELVVTVVQDGDDLWIVAQAATAEAGRLASVPFAPTGDTVPLVVPLVRSDELGRAAGQLVAYQRDVVPLSSRPGLLSPSELDADAVGAVELSVRRAVRQSLRAWVALLQQRDAVDPAIARAIERALHARTDESR